MYYYRFIFLLFISIGTLGSINAQQSSNFPKIRIHEVEELNDVDIFCMAQDSMGFMWFGTENGLIKYNGHTFARYVSDPLDSTSLGGSWFADLEVDHYGNLWVGLFGKGLNKFNPGTNTFTHYIPDSAILGQLKNLNIENLKFINRNELWIKTQGNLLSFNISTHLFSLPLNTKIPDLLHIFDLEIDQKGNIWMTTYIQRPSWLNLVYWKHDGTYEVFPIETSELNEKKIIQQNSLTIDSNGLIWAFFDEKLVRFDPNTQLFRHTQYDTTLLKGPVREVRSLQMHMDAQLILTDEMVSIFDQTTKQFYFMYQWPNEVSIQDLLSLEYIDQNKNIWIKPSYTNPLHFLRSGNQHFQHTNLDTPAQSFLRWGVKDLIVGTEKGFAFLQDGQLTELPDSLSNLNRFKKQTIFGLQLDQEGWLTLSTIPDLSFFRFNPRKNLFKRDAFIGAAIFSFVQDINGIFWLGTWSGLTRLDISNDSLKIYGKEIGCKTCLQDESVRTVYLDQQQQLWVGTQGAGLHHFDPLTEQFTQYPHRPGDSTSLSNNMILCIHEDQKGRFWVGTETGLNLFDRENGTSRWFLTQHGLPNNIITSITEDEQGYLWIGTTNGLSRFDPDREHFDNFDELDGAANYFNERAVYKDEQGRLYWGTDEGMLSFHPDSIQAPKWEFPLRLTAFKLKNELVKGSPTHPLLKQDIAYTQEITLPYDQNFFSLEYAALYYEAPEVVQYAYMLENLEESWQYVGYKREAAYTNVPPGNYIFKAKAQNGKGVWSSHEINLKITITPPWYWNIYTKSLYTILALALLFGIYHFQLTRKLEQAETRRLRELDHIKTQLYTNITHEFRTPLTIISGMADQIQENPKNWLKQGLEMIKRNSQMLLNLVNQMLDLRKLESGELAVNIVQNDILGYLKYIVESFHSYAASKDIRLHFISDLDELYMDYDPEKVLNIVSNLLSNAVKFTPEGGDVYLTVGSGQYSVGSGQLTVDRLQSANKLPTEDCLLLTVKDTGIGISDEQLPHIFDRFYQVDDSHTRTEGGSGIGLALTRELVKLLGGEISVKSKVGEGTEFRVLLPITRNEAIEAESNVNLIKEQVSAFVPVVASSATTPTPLITTELERPLALIIEDNKDVVRYLRACLVQDYRLEVAFDGHEGIEKALEIIPDIIISDVMMPKKDGFEVCEHLKNDTKTSHIPIILLTAKADVESRISGLKKGADAYLAKPFDKEELNVRLEQLILLRRKLHERYSAQNLEELSTTPQYELEDAFLIKVRELIQEHLSDAEFGTEALCKMLGMSRSQLFRKLKALTGSSIVRYIRSLRLQKAKALLQQSELNVSEIAYEVGFNDPAYFSRSFQEEYGVPPSAMRG